METSVWYYTTFKFKISNKCIKHQYQPDFSPFSGRTGLW